MLLVPPVAVGRVAFRTVSPSSYSYSSFSAFFVFLLRSSPSVDFFLSFVCVRISLSLFFCVLCSFPVPLASLLTIFASLLNASLLSFLFSSFFPNLFFSASSSLHLCHPNFPYPFFLFISYTFNFRLPLFLLRFISL